MGRGTYAWRCAVTFRPWPKRDLVKNHFPLPKEVFSLGLRSGEILAYSYLLYCEDRKT